MGALIEPIYGKNGKMINFTITKEGCDSLAREGDLSIGCIKRFKDKLNLESIVKHQDFTLGELGKLKDILDLSHVINYQNLDIVERFVRKFKDEIDWKAISFYFFKRLINANYYKQRFYLSPIKSLSKNLIKEFQHYLDWNDISLEFFIWDFDRDLIKDFGHLLNWEIISEEILTENIYRMRDLEKAIGDFQDKIIWELIPEKTIKKFSKEFMKKFGDRLNPLLKE